VCLNILIEDFVRDRNMSETQKEMIYIAWNTIRWLFSTCVMYLLL
jgi:hypothetical protein